MGRSICLALTPTEMEKLNQVPWKQLTHAYGSAEDVPELLLALRTARPDAPSDENSPLWCLFGNIWHQGTVYEATSYAVPFLLELASDAGTPDRIGILALLAEIAKSGLYASEDAEAVRAHNAVGAGFALLVTIADEKGAVALAAVHVLAQLPEFVTEVGPLLRRLFDAESSTLQRSGLLLLLGDLGDKSDEALSVLTKAVNDSDVTLRQAAVVSIARLKPNPLPPGAEYAILEALTANECVRFVGLPWDAEDEVDRYSDDLRACLNERQRDAMANVLIAAIESDKATVRQVSLLVDLLFVRTDKGPAPRLTAKDLSPIQKRAVVAMIQIMETGKRIFCSHFPMWGLPDTMREWRNLAAGRQPVPVDMSLPLLAEPLNPRQAIPASCLKLGQRILHRHFGLGVVAKIEVGERQTQFTVNFDEEGKKDFRL